MSPKTCKHFIVQGRVHGVCYRSETQDLAESLNLTGWVKNNVQGEVEVLACGSRDEIDQLYQWLKKGPRFAQVKQVLEKELPWQEHQDFRIRYD